MASFGLYDTAVSGQDVGIAQALAFAHSSSRPAMATAAAGTWGMEDAGRLQGLRLALMDTDEVRRLSVVEVKVPSTFTRNLPTPGGVNDLLMGSTDRQLRCGKCKGHCDGHYGHIELTRPILRMSYVKTTVAHLRTCCRVCSRPKWQSHGEGDAAMKAADVAWEGKRSPFVNAAHIFARTPPVGHERIRALAEACKNKLLCPWAFPVTLPDGSVIPACGAPQPTYRQSRDNKLVVLHNYGDKQLAAMRDPEERLWALERMNPAEIRSIIAATPVLTLAKMGYRMDPESVVPDADGAVRPRLLSHPKNFVMEVQLVLQNSVRPSIHLTDGSRCRGEDDLTRAYVGIVRANQELAKVAAVYDTARAAAQTSHAGKLHKVRDKLNKACGVQQECALAAAVSQQQADEANSNNTKTPHIHQELAQAALAKAAAAVDTANEEFATVLLAIEAVCAKEREAYYIAWDKLAVECAALITPAVRKAVKIEGAKEHRHGRTSRRKQQGLKERLTGKRGRFRGNLAGRRVDFSARGVVSPDVHHNIWELGVPAIVMSTLTFPARITSFNVRQLADRVARGADMDNGAVNVLRPDTTGAITTVSLAMLDATGRKDLASQLQVGWVVERMLKDGDWVMFNRQPSLHKASMMAFRVYKVPGLSFKLPLPCTSPFNADFDGDEESTRNACSATGLHLFHSLLALFSRARVPICVALRVRCVQMNMHCLQTWEAVAEAQEIMSVPLQMVTPASNSVIIALVQDALPIARKLTAKGTFLTREQVMQLSMCMQFNIKGATREELADMPTASTQWSTGFLDWLGQDRADVAAVRAPAVETFMPAPAILKGTTWHKDATTGRAVKTVHGPQWTGKQVVSWMLPRGMCLQKVLEDGVAPLDGWVPHTSFDKLEAARAALPALEEAAAAMAGCSIGASATLHEELRTAREAEAALASVKSWLDDDNVVLVKDGELLMGRLCKQTVGCVSGGFVHVLWRQYGPWAAAKWVSDAQRVLNQWGTTDSICISITDCVPSLEVETKIDGLVATAMGRTDALLETRAPPHIVELRTHKILQSLMREAGVLVLKDMPDDNGIYQIIKSGSKGKLLNIAQICSIVGPQSVFGSRIRMRRSVSGRRTLFNFAPNDMRAEARGFVANSFIRGLTPSEYFFHMMAGREGVVNTSINTAETGYSYKRMVQGEQSTAIMYDGTVRAGNYQLITLHYGDDDYDGSKLERVRMPALQWSNAQLRKRLGSTLSELCAAARASSTMRAQARSREPIIAAAEAFLAAEATWQQAAREILRSVRVGLGDDVPNDFAMPVNLEMLVESARLAAASTSALVQVPSTADVARRVVHLGQRTYQFLWYLADLHDGLAARKTRRARLPADMPLAHKLAAALLRSNEDYTSYGDPSRVARAIYTLQLASGNILRRHTMDSHMVDQLLSRAAVMYRRALVAPGEGVGALGASSMGEPSTQLTLNTFHTTGAENITNAPEGLPRFKQLINAQDTASTAKMTIRFKEPWASSEERVRAFATGAARVLLAEVTSASDIVHQPPLTTAEVPAALTDARDAGTTFAGLRRLLALEAISLVASSDGVLSTGFLAAQQLELECLSVDRVVSKMKKAVGKAVAAALLSSAALRASVKPDALKKRRATSACSGADMVATASRYLACFRLNRDVLYAKGLDVSTVELAMRRAMAHEASVVAADAVHMDWVLMFRPLDVPSRVGMTAAAWDTLADTDRAAIEKAVTEALHDALVESLVVHGHPAITQAVVRKEKRHTVNTSTGALEAVTTWVVDTEGSDMRSVALLPGVDIRATVTNNVREVNRVLGIEATVDLLQQQLHAVICTSGPYVDPRHMRLMALIMCRGGVFMSLNRHKIEKMGVAGVLQLASYEQTKEVFENGALFAKTDPLAGAIEKMIVGQPPNIGTGAFDVLAAITTMPPPEEYVAPLAVSDAKKETTYNYGGVLPLQRRHNPVQSSDDDTVGVQRIALVGKKRARPTDTWQEQGQEQGHNDERAIMPLAQLARSRGQGYEPSNPAHDATITAKLAAAVAIVAPLAAHVRNAARLSTLLELEARLGHLTTDGTFAPGVPASVFTKLESTLESYKGWSEAPPLVVHRGPPQSVWQQCTHDVYDLEDGTEARTISAWHLAHEGIIAKTHVSKQELECVDLAVAGGAAPLCVRVSLYAEEAVHTSRLPAKVLPKWVGIKQRKVYKKGPWTFTLTRVWGGSTNVEAEAAQIMSARALSGDASQADMTVYEVEVELAAPGDVLEQRGATDTSIAHALLARMHDLAGRHCTLVPLLRAYDDTNEDECGVAPMQEDGVQ